ncbi:MAG: hypothetical protein J6B55_05270 [Clostridia bacterium]|nr:hypothetical protein [Clostridia bacterium]
MLQIYRELPSMVRRDFDYEVTVHQGEQSGKPAVYNHTMEFVVYGRSVGGDTNRRFAMFAFDGSGVRVDIRVKKNFRRYMVIPSVKNFRSEFCDGVISVYLDRPDYFCVRLDDDDNTIISIFADEIMNPLHIPDPADPNTIVIDGVLSPEDGIYHVEEDNKNIYLTPGSVLNARVLIKGNNCKVWGRGAAVVDPYENIYRLSIISGGTEGSGHNLFTIAGANCQVDGVTLIDARCFNYTITADNVVLKNAKAMSTMMTTDGVSVYSGSGARVEHCFLYVADNAMVFSATNTHYKDITIGNTCTAVFPQVTVKDTLLEDIHIFRSNDGIINNIYNGREPVDRVVRWKIKNMDTVDCTYARYFLQIGNMGVIDDKHVVLENISTGSFSGNGAPHKYFKSPYVLRMVNWDNKLFTENYRVDFHNVYIDGHPVTELEESKCIFEKNPKTKVNITCDGAYTPVKRNEIAVNYVAPNRIFVGQQQVTFEHDPLWQDDVLYISAEEILAAMNKTCDVEATEINGVKYTTLDALVECGAAVKAGKRRDFFEIIPAYNGENLFKEDQGEVSHWGEQVCYMVDLVTERDENGEIYYSCQRIRNRDAGMNRFITEAVKMYGAGSYKVSFSCRAQEKGSLRFGVSYDDWQYATGYCNSFDVSTEWQSVSFDIEVDEDMVRGQSVSFRVISGETLMPRFDAKDFRLTKI